MNLRAAKRELLRWSAAAVIVFGSMQSAHAFCFTAACSEETPICTPSEGNSCEKPLHWDRSCVGFGVQEDGTGQLDWETSRKAITDAFDTWRYATCPDSGAYSGIDIIDMGDVPCARAEYNESAGNVNLVVFRDTKWPYKDDTDALALTTVTYANATGEILDADIEVNTKGFTLTATEPTEDYDLVGVLTHEVGHFLGMAHSMTEGSTMFSEAVPGSTDLRSLTEDDVLGLCTLYPPAADEEVVCNPIPIHGFAAECAADQWKDSCSTSPLHPVRSSSEGGVPWGIGLAGSCLALAWWHRQSRKRKPRLVRNPARENPTSVSSATTLDGL